MELVTREPKPWNFGSLSLLTNGMQDCCHCPGVLQVDHTWNQRSLLLQIGIVMVSCSCFAPTPSMAAMVVNRFKMREDVLTYNLSGMGCSSSLICVDMARHMLKALPNTLALIVNHENITQNWYTGNDRSMLVCNCLFRIGGAAALVSNRYVPCL